MNMCTPTARRARRSITMSALMLLLCADFSLGVQAATYYIDAISGNDAWSGTVNVPTGTPQSNGPWRTLARVQSATLAAGDTIFLRCDQIGRAHV